MEIKNGVNIIDNAVSFLEYDYLNKPGLPLPELLKQTLMRIPPCGQITRFKDMVAVEAIARLVDELSEGDSQKLDIVSRLKSAQSRML